MLKKLFLDLNNFKSNLGSVERGDSIELNIKLLNDEDYSRSKFRLLGAKSDGKSVEQIEGLNLEDKDLKVVLEDQFVNCEGIVKLELNVVSGETEITTKEFYFFVSNTMNASIIDSADSLPTLEKVSKYVDDAVDNLEALKGASEDITIINSEFKENEIKRKANEMLREKNEKARLQSEDIRITEEEERVANELERIKAENNRKVSESNRKVSENTRVTNERAREEAELSRQSTFEENEEIRNENENLRIEAEKERKLAFSNNNKFESERVEAEKLRAIAEDKRVTAEKARAKAEEERVKAETRRENTYTDFNDSEVERRNNEANRVRAEAERVNAESGRNELFNTNEEKRNSTFIESERTRERAFNEAQSNRNEAYEESERVREEAFKVSEVARNEAEEGRVAAELLRVEAEKLRVTGEENRNNTFTQSEEERKGIFEEAENARKATESKRVKAESSRVEAEKLRVSVETGRVEAENLRVTAEEERAAAETKRDEKIKELENKIDNGGNNSKNEEVIQARTATTGEVFNTLDERIDNEVDRLNKKIDVTMLQQEDKENHTIDNSIEGLTTDMIIKGKSMYKKAGGTYTDTWEEGVTLESFGQKENKISILSNGKNLFNDKIKLYNGTDKGNSAISFAKEGEYYIYEIPNSYNQALLHYDIKLPNENFKLIGEFEILSENIWKPISTPLTRFKENRPYLQFIDNWKSITKVRGKNIMLIYSKVNELYEPYKCDKKDILLQELGFDEGLRGINSVSDEINSIRKVTIKRIGKRGYREGDLLLDNVITDKTNTYYVLEEPIETPLDENINLKTFGERTYVSFENSISGTSSFKAPVDAAATISRLNRENRALEEENRSLRQDFESTTLSLTDSDLELVKQNVDMDFRLMEVEFALDIPQSTLSSNINFKKKGEVKSMARTPYEMMKIVILSGDYDREDYIHKVRKYYERGRMTKEEHDELMSLMTADEVISK